MRDWLNADPYDGTWDSVLENENNLLLKKKTQGNPCILIRIASIIEGLSAEDVILGQLDPKTRLEWDKTLAEYEILSKNKEKKEELIMFSIPVKL